MSENYMISLENSMNPSSQLNGGAHQSNQFQHPMNNEVHQSFSSNSIQPQNPSDLSHLNQQLPPQHSIQHPIQHSGPHQHHSSTSNPSQPPHLSTSSAPNSATVNLHSLSINPNSNPTSTANSASTPTGPNVNSGFVLRISNIPNDLTYREATIIFSLVIDHILKIELNSKESYILAFFNNFNTCVTTYKLLNQKCIFGNDTTPINVEIDESLSFEFNNLSLRNNGSMSAPASAISIHPSANGTISTILPSGKPQTSNVPPTSSGTIGSSSNRSRFSFNDPFHEFDPSHPHEQANSGAVTQNQPQSNQGQSGLGPLESNNSEINTWSTTNPLNSQASSQPQTPVNNLNFDWNQSSSASLASKNSSNRRTSSAFFQSNFSNNLLSNQFMNSNLNQPLLNQQTMPMVLNQPLVGQQQGQHGQNQQSQTGQQPQNQHSQGQSQGQNQGQSQGQNQGQNQSQPSSNPVSNPPSQNGSISNASQQPSNNNSSMPTPTTSQSVQVPNISPPSGTSQLSAQQPSQSQTQPQPQPQPSQTQQSQSAQQQSQGQGQTSSNITSPVQQGTTNAGKKDVPDLSLLARVPPPANPADQNPPCNTLYVGNLPPDATEQELRALFSPQKGFRRLSFRTKTNNNPGSSNHGPMCFVEFEDVAHATRALAELYGRILPRSSSSNGKGGIRLSFSKNPLGVRGPQRRSSSNQVNNGFNYNYHMKPN